jgi:hypothetical protein
MLGVLRIGVGNSVQGGNELLRYMDMKALLVVVVMVVIIWILISRRSPAATPKAEKPRKPSSSHSQPTFTSRIIEIFNNETEEFGQAWRIESATEKQIAYLSEILSEGDIPLPSSLTKGQASDAIGLFNEPGDEELEKLKFFKVQNSTKLNQTEARRAIYKLFDNPENVEKWENRPASAEQKDQIRFFGEKVPKGLKHIEATKLIDNLSESNIAQLERWDEMRSAYEDAVDADNRELYDIKKFSWTQFRETIEQMEAEGQQLADIVLDEEKIYEAILKKHPSLEK